MSKKIFVHILTFNSARYIKKCLSPVLSQEGFTLNQNLFIKITDNASTDNTISILNSDFSFIPVRTNHYNLGFAAGHNQGVEDFLKSSADYLLILNPDVYLTANFLQTFLHAANEVPGAGLFTPKLLRCNDELQPLSPPVIDAAGMILTNSLRHLDRGSNEIDEGQFDISEYVFGGTGACLLISRHAVTKLLIHRGPHECDLLKIFPRLEENRSLRPQLFDEAFFSYREDADLSWRAYNAKIFCYYVPVAIAYHKRLVLPENRTCLPQDLNRHSIRNRFLLQINNLHTGVTFAKLIYGLLIRNILVLLGVIIYERSSFPAFYELKMLFKRALEIRRENKGRSDV